jgi:enoyl-CoA hydratase
MTDAHATTTFADGVLTVTFDRQDKLNAISPEMTAVLWDAVNRLRDDDEVAVLVITAVGRYFTAGIDLGSAAGRAGDVDPDGALAGPQLRRNYRTHHLLYDEMEAVEKPIVLAAQGPCLGAGVEMAVSCDFRLAAASVWFRLPEIDLGVISGSGGVSRLTKLVGPGWARWMAMAGRPVDAQRALTIGLVQDVFPDDAFVDEVQRFGRDLTALPREAVGLSKLAIDASDATDRATARQFERLANTRLILSPDFRRRANERIRRK